MTDLNCHPFAHGQFMWMHNGCAGAHAALPPPAGRLTTPRRMVSHFSLIRRRLMESLKGDLFHAVLGNTDSEHRCASSLPHELALSS